MIARRNFAGRDCCGQNTEYDPGQSLEAAQAGNIAYRYLCVMAAGLSVLYMLYLLMFALQGLGDTVQPMLSGVVELILRICVAVTVALTGYEMGIMAAEPTAWVGCTLYLWYHYREKTKK